MASNNNPTGINAHKECPTKGDPHVEGLLREYHRKGNTDRKKVSSLLWTEHQIRMGEATVARRWKDMGITGSRIGTRDTPEVAKRQLVLDQMAKDPNSRQGPATIKEGIAFSTGVHLTRDYIRSEMLKNDPDGFAAREPTAKKVHRDVLISLGPHHEWSGDGHDKLAAIGFPIWGVRDKWSGRWLGLWVIPNNRLKESIAFLYLSLVAEYGGIPIQSTTDCGSETGTVYGFAVALREAFAPHLDVEVLPAHRFVKSIYNITIERGWLRLRLQWGDNVKVYWEQGAGIYNDSVPEQYMLVQWLWPQLIQGELDELKERFNSHVVRYDSKKFLPSGVSPNVSFHNPEAYNGEIDCLQPVNVGLVQQLMKDLGGESLIQFVTPEYAAHAQAVFDSFRITRLSFENVWAVFQEMLPHM